MKKEIIGHKTLHEENDLECICPECGKQALVCEDVIKLFGHSYRKYECNHCGCIWKVEKSW